MWMNNSFENNKFRNSFFSSILCTTFKKDSQAQKWQLSITFGVKNLGGLLLFIFFFSLSHLPMRSSNREHKNFAIRNENNATEIGPVWLEELSRAAIHIGPEDE